MARNMPSLFDGIGPGRWVSVPAVAGLLAILAMLPPWLPAWAEAIIVHAFAPVCHQLPARSIHVADTAFAVCDRCFGIYTGAVAGALACRLAMAFKIRAGSAWMLLGVGAAPAFADWLGPWLGLWTNTPLSRLLTGLWLGGAVAWLLVDALCSASSSTRKLA